MKTSREHMLLVALRLFAQKGYEATSIFDIAHELEITKGAIYKHFKNKQDILDAIISKMEENDQRFAEQFIMPIHVLSLEELEAYQKVTIKQVIDFSLAMFTYWTEDEFASLFRKMLTIEQYEKAFDDLKITDAFIAAMNLISRANKYIDETTPWALAKDETKVEELKSVMSHLANVLYISGVLLQPVLTHAPKELFRQLGVPGSLQNYESIRNFGVLGDVDVTKGNPLFPRLDAKVEVEFIASLMQKK